MAIRTDAGAGHSRRRFMIHAGVAAAAVASPGRARAAGANGRFVVGVIGPGGMGTNLLKSFASMKDVDVAYVCDIEDGRLSAAVCHLGNIATRVGRVSRFEAGSERVVGDEEAGRRIRREVMNLGNGSGGLDGNGAAGMAAHCYKRLASDSGATVSDTRAGAQRFVIGGRAEGGRGRLGRGS